MDVDDDVDVDDTGNTEILLVTTSRQQVYATFIRSRKMCLFLLQYKVLLLFYKNRNKNF